MENEHDVTTAQGKIPEDKVPQTTGLATPGEQAEEHQGDDKSEAAANAEAVRSEDGGVTLGGSEQQDKPVLSSDGILPQLQAQCHSDLAEDETQSQLMPSDVKAESNTQLNSTECQSSAVSDSSTGSVAGANPSENNVKSDINVEGTNADPKPEPEPALFTSAEEAQFSDGAISLAVPIAGGGVTDPAASPGFRPYSETPQFSEDGLRTPTPTPTPPSTPPPPKAPCSGNWHHKTVDDLIALDVPDTRIPRCVGWGPCEIRGWLDRLGLPQYAEGLLNNGICGRRLCLLTASNLPRMGVTDWLHIRAIAGSARRLLSVDDYVLYDQTWWKPPPADMTRALYLQCAWPSGQPPPSSDRYLHFLRSFGFLDVLANVTNRPIVSPPMAPDNGLFREIQVASLADVCVPSQSASDISSAGSRQSQTDTPSRRTD